MELIVHDPHSMDWVIPASPATKTLSPQIPSQRVLALADLISRVTEHLRTRDTETEWPLPRAAASMIDRV